MLRAISFKVAWDGAEKFSHFINGVGEISVTDRDAEVAKVCVMANSRAEVTEEQVEAVAILCGLATEANPHICITYHAGLSPFLPVPVNQYQGVLSL